MKEFKLYLNGLTCANCGNKIERKVDSLKEVEEAVLNFSVGTLTIELKDEKDNDNNLSFHILIRNLNQEEKTILTLYYCSQYTTREIADILKIKENTIKSKIIRAKNKLKTEYEGELYEGELYEKY